LRIIIEEKRREEKISYEVRARRLKIKITEVKISDEDYEWIIEEFKSS